MTTIVFVLSADRSGSTWLGYVLGSHSQSAFLGEYYRGWNAHLRQPCTTCLAAGFAECQVLHGFEHVLVEDAFAFAFERTGKSVLVDTSKTIEWARGFAAASRFEIRLIHLVRDPRGWFASQRRRLSVSDEDMLRLWCEANTAIGEFTAGSGHPHRTVFYDELAGDPLRRLPPLFEFCGMSFEAAALEYWQFPHHAFAANGATSALLSGRPRVVPVDHFLTGDDAFYAKQDRSLFIDTRWRRQLSAPQLDAIMGDAEIGALLASLGRRMSDDGLAEIAGQHDPRSILDRLKAVFTGAG